MAKRIRKKSQADEFGEKVAEVLESQEVEAVDDPVKLWLSTGSTVLDLAVSNSHPGGLPMGRYIHIYGAESTCKTVLAMTVLGAAQRSGAIAFFADIENTFDFKWARLFGLQCDDTDIWRLGNWWEKNTDGFPEQPGSIEEFFDEYLCKIIALDDPRPKVVAVDSLSALPSNVEIETALDKASFQATRAKQMSTAMRKYQRVLSKHDITLLLIDQARDTFNAFGEKETTSGGRAVKFYSSVRIHLKSGSKIKNSKDQHIGIWVPFNIVKNKVASPHRSGQFKIIWDYGIDDVHGNLAFIKDYQEKYEKDADKKSTRKSSFVTFNGETKIVSRMIQYVEDEGLEDKLATEVSRLWQELLKPDKIRKQREWK